MSERSIQDARSPRPQVAHARSQRHDAALSASGYLSVRGLFETLGRRWRLVAVLSAALIGLFAVPILRMPSYYAAEAQLLLPPVQRSLTAAAGSDAPVDDGAVRTEVLVLQSPQLIMRVVETLGLASHAEMAGAGAGVSGLVARWFGKQEQDGGPRAKLRRAAAEVGRRLTAARAGETRVIRVGFWSGDPELPHTVVNAVLREHLAAQAVERGRAAMEVGQLLVGPLRELEDRVRASEEALERYRVKSGIIEVLDTPLIARQISDVTEQIANARAARTEAESRAQVGGGTAEGLRRDLAVQRLREDALRQELDRLKSEYERQNEARIRARELEREAAANRAVLQSFRERYAQLQVQSIAERPTATVQSWAMEPIQPAGPRRALLLAVAGMAALGAAALVALLLDALRGPARAEPGP